MLTREQMMLLCTDITSSIATAKCHGVTLWPWSQNKTSTSSSFCQHASDLDLLESHLTTTIIIIRKYQTVTNIVCKPSAADPSALSCVHTSDIDLLQSKSTVLGLSTANIDQFRILTWMPNILDAETLLDPLTSFTLHCVEHLHGGEIWTLSTDM